jgi:hypothetical protein
MQAQLIEQLKALRLRGMASALQESLTALSQKKLAPTTGLGQLLSAETADRQARSGHSRNTVTALLDSGNPNARPDFIRDGGLHARRFVMSTRSQASASIERMRKPVSTAKRAASFKCGRSSLTR